MPYLPIMNPMYLLQNISTGANRNATSLIHDKPYKIVKAGNIITSEQLSAKMILNEINSKENNS